MAKISPSTWEEGVLAKGVPKGVPFTQWVHSAKSTPPHPPFRGPGFPESAQNVSPNEWISDSGGKKDHLLKVFVLW